MSKFASGMRKGKRVKQGDVIGYVGMTGSTAGPHVCYRFWKYGKQVDPLKEKLPSAKPMKKEVKPIFFEYIKALKYQLDYERVPVKEPNVVKEIIAQN